MWSHLQKAIQLYHSEGKLNVLKSIFRYIPIEINNIIFYTRYGGGARIMDEDWDNLIILDACRYDMLESYICPDVSLESRISLGSSSEEFMERNYVGREHYDTVYVNANPFIPRLDIDTGVFYHVVDCLQEWDKELETVPPSVVSQAACRAHQKYPYKRLIVHFMQPHAPFIGEYGQRMVEEVWSDQNPVDEWPGIWNLLREGVEIPLDSVWKAYEENLNLVMSEVSSLVNELNGKSVITSDHGNLVGERLSPIPSKKMYGHPYGVHTKELVKVPWLVINPGTRRDTTSQEPKENACGDHSRTRLDDRLEALGYR